MRSYQRKVQRLEEGSTDSAKTLWEAVLQFIEKENAIGRTRVLERFRNDDRTSVIAVLNDLVGSGLVYATGRGTSKLYRATSDTERKAVESTESLDTLAHLLWGEIFRHPRLTAADLTECFSTIDPSRVSQALERLLTEGRIQREGEGLAARFESGPFLIPVDSQQGWEAAVFDHFQAVASAIINKLRNRDNGSTGHLGGTTMRFGIYPGHPHETETLGTLGRLRSELNVLWSKVNDYNEANPKPDPEMTQVTVYFGQDVRHPDNS